MNHRRIISLLSAALLGLSAAAFPPAAFEPVSIVAEAATSGNWEYTVENGNATITGYNGTSATPSIPSSINGKTVTKIGNYAFLPTVNGNYVPKNITSVTIPNTVTEIGKCAFARTPLTSVTIPSSVRTIKDTAFAGCSYMTHLRVEGAATIEGNAFKDCTSLRNLLLHKDCVPKRRNTSSDHGYVTVFSNCPNISTLNNASIWKKVLVNGVQKPVINSDSIRRELIKRFLWVKGTNCDEINQYCTALCDYIVKTETTYGSEDDWMCDAVKARQLYKWLIDHCDFETDNTTFSNYENQDYSSVFVSYGLNGEGESVCAGYSKAYAMLLHAAGIESYLVHANLSEWGLSQMTPEEQAYWGTGGHMWNIVKADGKYYQCDVSRADTANSGFLPFMRTDVEMFGVHEYAYTSTELSMDQNNAHPYLSFDANSGEYARTHCYYHFEDNNYDGLLDGDWDFNGTVEDWDDYLIYSKICAVCNVPYMEIENQPNFLNNLLIWKMSPAQWSHQA